MGQVYASPMATCSAHSLDGVVVASFPVPHDSVCFYQATSSAGGQKERQVMDPPNYVSLLIRLWREPASELADQAAGWQGEVEHIQSGRRWTFDGLDQLFASIRRQVEGSEEPK
jgi:hypothetical protein